MRSLLLGIWATLSLAACHQECVAHPCPLPIALEVVVAAATSGAGVSGASVVVTGAASVTQSCDSSCIIPGYAGSYTLMVTAPGYQPAESTVVVQGSNPGCGCASARTEHVSFVLALTP